MGFQKVIFFEGVPLEYICMHCQDVLEAAESAPCGHTLCAACFIKRGRKARICPLCPETLLDKSKILRLTEINEQINKLTTWCNYEGCHEHVPLLDRQKHLRECPRRNDIKKSYVRPDHVVQEMGEGSENTPEDKSKQRRRMLYRIGASLCLYGVFTTVGLPGDRIADSIPWCGVEDLRHFVSGI